jgi:hypothetical protein
LRTHPERTRAQTIPQALAIALLALLLGALVVAATSTRWFASFGGTLDGARLERARQSPHFDGKKFVNPAPTRMLVAGTTWEMIRHEFLGKEQRVPPRPLPVVPRSAADYGLPPPSDLRATWIGHASTLVEIDGHRLLTDPIPTRA